MTAKENPLNGTFREILREQNFDSDAKIIDDKGSEKGDGYSGAHVIATLSDKGKKLNLFIKRSSEEILKGSFEEFMRRAYATECDFYDVVAPALFKFQSEKREAGNFDVFDNIPKCYKTKKSDDYFVIALENIKENGFKLHDRRKVMNENHILLAFKTFARFHAISYAMKDQKHDDYQFIAGKLPDLIPERDFVRTGFDEVVDYLFGTIVGEFDDDLKSKCERLRGKINYVFSSEFKYSKEFAAITQGDCWCNNMMFKYESDNEDDPVDICLFDFQIAKVISPVFDLSYFFYVAAGEDSINKLDDYLNYYHQQLSDRITLLGSDPKRLYPISVFLREWKDYAVYGVAMSMLVIKLMLMNNDEVPELKDMKSFGKNVADVKIQDHETYMERMRVLFEHLLNLIQ